MKPDRLLRASIVLCLTALGCSAPDGRAPDGPQAEAKLSARASLPSKVRAAVEAHVRGDVGARRDGWKGIAVPSEGTAIFEPDNEQPMFYQVSLTGSAGEPRGYAVVTANEPLSIIEFNDTGVGPVERLEQQANASVARVVRLDTALYVAENASRQVVAQSVRSITRFDRSGDRGLLIPTGVDEALRTFTAARLSYTVQSGGGSSSSSCAVALDIPKYVQIAPNSYPNTSSCHSGCGATAWTMIFGWASKRATESSTDWPFGNIFRSGTGALGAPVLAPSYQDWNVGQNEWALRNDLSTFCVNDQGATPPWNMQSAQNFVSARTSGVAVEVAYNALMVSEDRLYDSAVRTVCENRPVILGIGALFGGDLHYPVASRYDNGWFYLNMGWGGSGDGWYQTQTWFSGTIRRQ
jgi:hypothetical protein